MNATFTTVKQKIWKKSEYFATLGKGQFKVKYVYNSPQLIVSNDR
jgi:hypothetical protein